jgi:hypothetical protein
MSAAVSQVWADMQAAARETRISARESRIDRMRCRNCGGHWDTCLGKMRCGDWATGRDAPTPVMPNLGSHHRSERYGVTKGYDNV